MAERLRLNGPLLALGSLLVALGVAEMSAQSAFLVDRSAILMLISALPFAAAVWWILRTPASRGTLLIVLAVAAILRLLALFSPPALSSDLNRFIWDGRVQAAGINPYLYVPADPVLERLRDPKIYPAINRKDYGHTIYPPFAQAVFFLTTRISETTFWMKATMLGFDLVAIVLLGRLLVLSGLPLQRLLLYVWHPLPIWEMTGAGHLDAIMVAAIALALLFAWHGKRTLTGLALAAAFLVKFFPLVLLPVFHRRRDWRLPAVFALAVIVAYLPYYLTAGVDASPVEKLKTVLGFLGQYTKEEGLQSGSGFFLISFFPPLPWLRTLYLAVAATGTIILGAYVWLKPSRDAFSIFRRGLAMVAAVIVVGSPHYSWYACWAIPFFCFVTSRAMLWISLTIPALYISWYFPGTNALLWINSAIYFPAALLALYDFRKSPAL